jgi:hypothetical protein
MWPKIGVLALAASLVPLVACTGQSNAQEGGGASPEMRAKMDAVRTDAKTATFAALSDVHRTAVQAIVDQFDADGSTLTLSAATQQIDALLSPQETTAVLAQNQKMRDAMRAAFASSGGGPGGGQGGPGGGRGFGGPGGGRRAPDAGRFILQVDALPDKYREAARAERGQQSPGN